MKASVTTVRTMWPTSLAAAGAPGVISVRDVIGKASHSSATIPWAMSSRPVTRQGALSVGRPQDTDAEGGRQERPQREEGREEGFRR